MITLDGKTALITGAAGGIGQVLCRQFVELGARVIASDREADRLTAYLAEAGAGDRMVPMVADVTDAAGVATALSAAIARAGAPTILVNNAGFAVADRSRKRQNKRPIKRLCFPME